MLSALRGAFIGAGHVKVVAVLASLLVLVTGPAANGASVTEITCLRDALQLAWPVLLHRSKGRRLQGRGDGASVMAAYLVVFEAHGRMEVSMERNR